MRLVRDKTPTPAESEGVERMPWLPKVLLKAQASVSMTTDSAIALTGWSK